MKFIEYRRCSTVRQYDSSLGLESQRASIHNYVKSIGGNIIDEFLEVESGGNKDRISIDNNLSLEILLSKRPILLNAIRKAQEANAIIIVKSACRLSRYSLLIDYMLSCNIQFVCSDSPKDTPFIIKLKTSLNEEELIKISERTKNALSALRDRGYKWIPKKKFTDEDREKASKRNKELAIENPNYKRAIAYIIQLREKSELTYEAISENLNLAGFKSSRGNDFTPASVFSLYRKAKGSN